MLMLRARRFETIERATQWPDALVLGLFSASGTQLALGQDLPAIVAVLIGMVNAVFGGVLRDIVVNEIPRAFKDRQPYAVCAFAGGWVLVAAQRLGTSELLALTAAAAAASTLRLAALHFDWRLPQWRTGPGDGDQAS
jgi:uncharacterized membrane protein YeiH